MDLFRIINIILSILNNIWINSYWIIYFQILYFGYNEYSIIELNISDNILI